MEITRKPEDNFLLQILKEENLEEFYDPIRRELQLFKLLDYNFANPEDFEKVGISKPAARRLLHSIKEKRRALKLNSYLNKLWLPLRPLVQRNQSDKQEKAPNIQTSSYYYIPESEITTIEQLGMGSFGVVWKAKWTPRGMDSCI